MVNKGLRNYIAENYDEKLILFDSQSYDNSIIYVTDDNKHVVYSYERMIDELMTDNNWSYDDAIDWLEFNTIGSMKSGDYEPLIVHEDEYLKQKAPDDIDEALLVELLTKYNKLLTNKGLLKEELIEPGFVKKVAVPAIYQKEPQKPLVICVVGPSGCGKTTLVNYVADENPRVGVVVSYTTRPMRENERNGVDHRFVAASDIPDTSEMVAYTYFNDNHYWATRKQLHEYDVMLYVIDEAGVRYFQSVNNGEFDIKTLYIECNDSNVDQARKERDKERIIIDRDEYDAVITNSFTAGTLEEFLKTGYETIMQLAENE